MTSQERFEELRRTFLPRFYDPENKVMIYPEWLEDDNCMTYRMLVKGEQFRSSTLLDFMIFCEDLIMMKPTGQKDLNGNIIYQDDFVKDGTGDEFIVVFDEESASFRLQEDNVLHEFDSDIEVYSNIHENPELMEDM